MPSKQQAKNTYRKLLDDIAGICDRAPRESIMEPHGLKSCGILRRRITETEADHD